MKRKRYIIAYAIMLAMLIISDIFGRKFIAAESAMLAFGLLCTDKIPWKTDKVRTLILTALAAAVGYAAQKYIPFPDYFKLLIAIGVTGIISILADCKLMSVYAVSAAPIIFGLTDLVYPIMITAMTAVICITWRIMVNTGMKEGSLRFRYLPDFESDMSLWTLMLVGMAVLALYPFYARELLILSPPILTVYAESCYRDLRGKRIRIIFVTAVAAVAGVLSEYFISGVLGMPRCVGASVALVLTVLEMNLMAMPFAPICAVALVPYLTDVDFFAFPIQTAVSTAAVLVMGGMIRGKAFHRRRVKGKHAKGRNRDVNEEKQ